MFLLLAEVPPFTHFLKLARLRDGSFFLVTFPRLWKRRGALFLLRIPSWVVERRVIFLLHNSSSRSNNVVPLVRWLPRLFVKSLPLSLSEVTFCLACFFVRFFFCCCPVKHLCSVLICFMLLTAASAFDTARSDSKEPSPSFGKICPQIGATSRRMVVRVIRSSYHLARE